MREYLLKHYPTLFFKTIKVDQGKGKRMLTVKVAVEPIVTETEIVWEIRKTPTTGPIFLSKNVKL